MTSKAAITDRSAELKHAQSLAQSGKLSEAESAYLSVVRKQISPTDELALREQELAITSLGDLYRDAKDSKSLVNLVKESKDFTTSFSKAKTAKIVRYLVDLFSSIPGATQTQIDIIRECIDWAVSTKRIFLRQSLESRLASLLLESAKYAEAIKIIGPLLKELRKLDDKMQLVEVQLLESKIFHSIRNLPRSKTSLTSARTAANSIYCPPLLQASLDLQSGILHADDKDYKTAYSYFYEALDGFSAQNDPRATSTLKYMLLSKIMLGLTDDVHSILASKVAQKHTGPGVEAMKVIAKAYQERNLEDFNRAVESYKVELGNDPVIRSHLSGLYDALLETNLVKIIEPFTRVEISHIASLVGLGVTQVEDKYVSQPLSNSAYDYRLSQMILDKVISGVLDQGSGCLIVFEEPETDKTYEAALETIKHMSTVVDLLYEKVCTLSSSTN